MFHPVGSQPPSVYWRRRVIAVAAAITLVVLLALTLGVLFSGGGGGTANAGQSTPKVSASPTSRNTRSPRPTRTHSRTATRSASGSTSPAGGTTSSVAAVPCSVAALSLTAQSNQSQYSVEDDPVLSIVVRNPGPTACVQDLADRQILLRVYNGESRVWGSHDCKIEPGTDDRTLAPRSSVRVSVVWGAMSSRPRCAGTRQHVGAGTYTLYASLAGREAAAAQFTIG